MSPGYSLDMFLTEPQATYLCQICKLIVKDPLQCSQCGLMFCSGCSRNNVCSKCPRALSTPDKFILRCYSDLQLKCGHCSKKCAMSNFVAHQKQCGRVKCQFSNICGGLISVNSKTQFCSKVCQLTQSLILANQTPAEITRLLTLYEQQNKIELNMSSSVSISQQKLTFNTLQKRSHITFKGDNNVFLNEPSYNFRTVITEQAFTAGEHYWQVIIDNKTENQLKLGVAVGDKFDINTAFCDHNIGFAYYTCGQLRFSSNATGLQYGAKVKSEGTIGVYLNMNEGTLAFSLNGRFLGWAYRNKLLKEGPIYPAIALLHKAGCAINGEMDVPPIFYVPVSNVPGEL